jgi:hypothetical protein
MEYSIPREGEVFTQQYRASLTVLELNSAISSVVVMFVRERRYTFPEFFTLSYAQLPDIISAFATL